MGRMRGAAWGRAAGIVAAVLLALGMGGTLLAQTPPPSIRGMIAVVIEPEGLNLRGGPGTQYESLAVIPRGAELPILGERENTFWIPVSYQGRLGFVHGEYVQIRAATGASASPSPSGSTAPAVGVVASPSAALAAPGASASPASSASPSPSATPTPSPTPSPTPRPTPPPAPAGPPPMPVFDNGILLSGVFASDWDDMITIADEFNLVAVVRPPEGVTSLTMRVSGAPFLSAQQTFEVNPAAENWIQIANFKVDTENEPVLREELVRKVGGSIAIRDGALALAIDYKDAQGADRTASFQPTVHEYDRPGVIAKVEYPDLKRSTGMPPGAEPTADNFYLRGDADFHHPDDFYVRKLAIEMGRRGGVFPDDPELVADNVFLYINATFGDGDPGDFNNDYNIARLMDEGTIARGRINGAYICIGQVYLMTAMTRTLGLPSRELNLAIGKPNWLGNDGYWRVTWFQNAAVHTWYNGRWNHYDLWLGFKGMNGYFEANLAYQAWASFDRRTVPFLVNNSGIPTGLRGHDFGAWPGDPAQWNFVREASKPGVAVLDIPPENGDPVSAPAGRSLYRDSADLPPAGPTFRIGRPPPKGIIGPPQSSGP